MNGSLSYHSYALLLPALHAMHVYDARKQLGFLDADAIPYSFAMSSSVATWACFFGTHSISSPCTRWRLYLGWDWEPYTDEHLTIACWVAWATIYVKGARCHILYRPITHPFSDN